ncbi:hypothetical protein AVEN_48328-1 [Araneus ventricosus]|uniref:Uncharacterized protein n=1 Tax=Araneus ventricosus TaxID=182803 RepID=A0A4Y2M3A5_ARAVE|nr:hypothetical protein AVEN_48328-1 [Araneus ventricosus]
MESVLAHMQWNVIDTEFQIEQLLHLPVRKDNTKVLIKKDTRYYEDYERGALHSCKLPVYIGHVTAAAGGAKAIKEAILNFLEHIICD